jgi:sugar/nucleoside kinase (ribokinase family)
LRTAFVGVAGDDEFGRYMSRALAERGVDMTALAIDPSQSTGLSVHLAHGADRAILTYAGTIAGLRLEHLDLSLLQRARHVHLGSFFLLDGLRPDVAGLFAQAHRLGLTTSLDTNYDPSGKWNGDLQAALHHTDLFFPNETEACAITGRENPLEALEELSHHAPVVVLKRGAAGAIARRGSEMVEVEPLPVVVVDTAGAGDTFDAGFVYGWLQGWDLRRCLQMAVACGSLSTRESGGVNGQPTLGQATKAAGLS